MILPFVGFDILVLEPNVHWNGTNLGGYAVIGVVFTGGWFILWAGIDYKMLFLGGDDE